MAIGKELQKWSSFFCQKFGGLIPIAYLCDKKNELAAHVRLGNSSVYFNSETQLLSLMAGRTLRGMLSTADYKDGKALKSCHTEFCSYLRCGFLYIGGYA